VQRFFKILFPILLCSLSGLEALAKDLSTLNLNRPVNDFSRMLSQQELAATENLLHDIKQKTGTQIGIVTLNSLEGESIEQVAIAIAERWGLGTAKADNGVLIVIAKDERQLRIEVGQGLEGALPDAYAKRIIDQDITPSFKLGQFGRGILLGIERIIHHTNPAYISSSSNSSTLFSESTHPSVSTTMSWPARIFTIIMVLFLIFTPVGRTILMAMLLSGMGRRSSGGFSRGGRGYSGGGGGFSGGGASGGW